MNAHGAPSARQIQHEVRLTDRDRTLAAMHHLEGALGAAAPGRETSWRAGVLNALAQLDTPCSHDADVNNVVGADIS
jgi:hypothetical protein